MTMTIDPLRKVHGPACTRCGCEAGTALRAFSHWSGEKMERRACDHCGHEFTATRPADDAEPPMVIVPVAIFHEVQARCPACGGEGKVQRTAGRVRYCKCAECGENFKAVPEK